MVYLYSIAASLADSITGGDAIFLQITLLILTTTLTTGCLPSSDTETAFRMFWQSFHFLHSVSNIFEHAPSLASILFTDTKFSDFMEVCPVCGLVVRVPGYRSRGPGFDCRRYQIFWEVVGLEWGSLSLVRIIQQLLERTVAAPV
jgi:hypothetical protein